MTPFGPSFQLGECPQLAESDCKRLLPGDGIGQSCGTFWSASVSELPHYVAQRMTAYLTRNRSLRRTIGHNETLAQSKYSPDCSHSI